MVSIWKKDVHSFFLTPAGYVFVGTFLLVMNLYFFVVNVVMETSSDLSACFETILFVLIFLVPLLTMRLFSEEYRQRTDQLLVTATGSRPIVLGKFLAAMTVFAIALAGTLPWVVIISVFGVPDAAAIAGSYTATLCAAMAFISVGLFISSLTQSQVTAAVGTIGFFLGVYFLDIAAAGLSIPVLGAVTGWLSLFKRYAGFSLGLFSLGDIVYYLSFTALFLFLTARVLERRRLA